MSFLVTAAIGYVIGAAPIIYLLAKTRGFDLHAVGTGNIGGGNLWRYAGPRLGAVGIVVDIGKGVAPPLIARALGMGVTEELAGALAAVIGQMWPITLRFQGGRGNSTGAGALLALSPALFLSVFALFLAMIAPKVVSILAKSEGVTTGRSKTVPIAVITSFAVYGILAYVVGQQVPFIAAMACIGLILFRRATAPWPPDPITGEPPERSLISILLLDRPTTTKTP